MMQQGKQWVEKRRYILSVSARFTRVRVTSLLTSSYCYYPFKRDVSAEYYQQHPMVIGSHPEIDESNFGWRKWSVARRPLGIWRVERIMERVSWLKWPREMLQHSADKGVNHWNQGFWYMVSAHPILRDASNKSLGSAPSATKDYTSTLVQQTVRYNSNSNSNSSFRS